jgi:hypothetical protein
MSNFKKAKKIAKKAYKKVPKKKLINKAASFGVKQIIGGPYIDIAQIFMKKSKKKILSYAGSYAYDSFLRSKYARNTINVLPMSIVAVIFRIVVSFLILSRITIGIWWLDSIISVAVTVIMTLLSPFFYKSVKAHEDIFLVYTNDFMDNFMGPDGWVYVENVQNRIFLIVGMGLMILFKLVDINSDHLFWMVFHGMITGFISGQIQQRLDEISDPQQVYYGMEWIGPYKLGPENYFTTPSKHAHTCHTDNREIIGDKPQRAVKISKENLKTVAKQLNNKTTNNKGKHKKLEFISIIESYAETK